MSTRPAEYVRAMASSEHQIRVKAMLIAPDSEVKAHAVSVCPPTHENPRGYHRLIGGGVEMGETHRQAVIREVREELNASIRDLTYLDVLESIYSINGRDGHEIVFVYTGRLDPEPARDGAELAEADGSVLPVVWRPLDDADEPLALYPSAAAALAGRLLT
jgi:ADP-ribose pyrophosphatase YjhB (NUDIX family)